MCWRKGILLYAEGIMSTIRAQKKPERLEKLAEIAQLLDIYGDLLTERQALALRLFYEEDFSLAEIAGQLGGSRQASHDLIRRGEALLFYYEDTLHCLEKKTSLLGILDELTACLERQGLNESEKCLLARLALDV